MKTGRTAARAPGKRQTQAALARRGPEMNRKAFLARAIKRSMEEGEKMLHPVRVAVCAEKQWDGKWFDVTLSSDGETIAVASFRRIQDARAYRKRIIEALRAPGLDGRTRTHAGRKRTFAMEIKRRDDEARPLLQAQV